MFVAQWTGRIDAYLAGSPMAGTGKVFAEAAWDYGVDPRWSPAISNTESSKGLYCSGSCNAWGWGGCSWGSWEEAIRDHVARPCPRLRLHHLGGCRQEVLPAELGALVQRNACANEYDLARNPATRRVSC